MIFHNLHVNSRIHKNGGQNNNGGGEGEGFGASNLLGLGRTPGKMTILSLNYSKWNRGMQKWIDQYIESKKSIINF